MYSEQSTILFASLRFHALHIHLLAIDVTFEYEALARYPERTFRVAEQEIVALCVGADEDVMLVPAFI